MTSSTDAVTRDWEGLTIPTAGTYLLDAAHKRVGFVARHMMVSKVRGEFAEATATITVAEDPLQSSVTATIQAASIDTGQADRDAHLRSPRLPGRREVPDAGVPQHRREVPQRQRVRPRRRADHQGRHPPGRAARSSSRVSAAARSARTSSASPRPPRSTARTSA